MKYNKSEIMKAAWNLYRKAQKWVNTLRFAECLRRAWSDAKAAAEISAKLDTAEIAKSINGCIVYLRRSAIAMTGRMGWYLTGNTYPVRKQIKAAGFKWDIEARAWHTLDHEVAARFAR